MPKPNEAAACAWCSEPFDERDADFLHEFPYLRMHNDCAIRSVAGSVAHQRRECACIGGTGDDPEGMTRRQAATLAANILRAKQNAHLN